MRVIALEEHVLPRDIIEAAGIDIGLRANKRADELDEMGEGRLRVMDDAGIDIQVLSALSNTVQDLEPVRSVDVSRRINDRMAQTVTKYPDRFRAFAALPMTDPEGAAGRSAPLFRGDPGLAGARVTRWCGRLAS